MTFSSQVFRILPLFSLIFRIFTLLDIVHNPFLTRKHLFLLFSYFRAHPTTLLLKILGGRMHGPSPPQTLGGPSPQSPLGFRPCMSCFMTIIIQHTTPVYNLILQTTQICYLGLQLQNACSSRIMKLITSLNYGETRFIYDLFSTYSHRLCKWLGLLNMLTYADFRLAEIG